MKEKIVEVSVSVDGRKVILEGPESFVRAEVQRLTNSLAGIRNTPHAVAPQTDSTTADGRQPNERDFIAEKRPQGHQERVAVLAFWLKEHGLSEFSDTDLRQAYIRAGVRPPKAIGQAIRDAGRLKGYVQSTNKRGKYRITDHGDSFVRFDLPRLQTK